MEQLSCSIRISLVSPKTGHQKQNMFFRFSALEYKSRLD